MIKKFNEFINEGVRDQMTPLPTQDVINKFSSLSKEEMMDTITNTHKEDYFYEDITILFSAIKEGIGVDAYERLDITEDDIWEGNVNLVESDVLGCLTVPELIKLYKWYYQLEESIRNQMTPKSEEDIKKELDKMISLKDKLKYIEEYKLEKFYSEPELKEMLCDRIYYFFQGSRKKEYMFFARDTQHIHGINRFDVGEGEVVGIVDLGVILKDDNIVYYQDLKISELENVISCFIEPIENKED